MKPAMPRYHFNIRDGEDLPDVEGSELADIQAARVTAIRFAGEMLRDHASRFWNGHEWQMDVTDDTGLTLFVLSFHAVDAPAAPRQASVHAARNGATE